MSPDPLYPLVIRPPAFGPQKGCNAAVAVPPMLAGHPDEPLQPSVLLPEILQPLRLIRPQPAVLPLPSVVRLLGHAKLPDHLGHRLPLSQPNLSLAELPNDLLRSELLTS